MKVIVKNIFDKEFTLEKITELSYSQSFGAPCDAVLISFKDTVDLGEVYSVRLYDANKLVFNGYCDNQKRIENKNGVKCSIYARSSACILVDNKSQPFTYLNPTARQLFLAYASDKGFSFALPELSCNDKYEVSMGTSCFGAINNFVSLLTGSRIYVDENDTLRLFKQSSELKRLDSLKLISTAEIINRSAVLSQINYKDSLSSEYTLHTASRLANELKINRQEYFNLTSLPRWQRDYMIEKRLTASFNDYRIIEASISGFCDEKLGMRFAVSDRSGDVCEYILREKHYTYSLSEEKTKLTLKKICSTGGFTYVA